jgi:hypothetical protein
LGNLITRKRHGCLLALAVPAPIWDYNRKKETVAQKLYFYNGPPAVINISLSLSLSFHLYSQRKTLLSLPKTIKELRWKSKMIKCQ